MFKNVIVMKIRSKITGEVIDDVYNEGTVISKSGIIPVYYKFGDKYKIPYYGNEYVVLNSI